MIQRSLFDTIVRFVVRSPRQMGEKPFLGFFILLCVALLISSLVFYRYVLMARNEDVADEVTRIRLDEQKFQQVIQVWQAREEKFDQAGKTQIRDIFARREKVVEEVQEEPEI